MGAPAVAPLVDALADPAEHVRASAAYGLGEMGAAGTGAVNALIAAVRDDTAPVRFHAISALGMIGEPRAPIIDALIPVLDSDDGGEPLFEVGVTRSQLRNVAVQALIRIDARTPEATAALARAVTDRGAVRGGVRRRAVAAHRHAGGARRPGDALSWTRWFSSPVVSGGGPQAVLREADEGVSAAARRSAGHRGIAGH